MKFTPELAAVHGYLCGDGYVTKNGPQQNHIYYRIGFRNTNKELLLDFQKNFHTYFKIKPYLIEGERCRLSNKEIYCLLTKEQDFYSYTWKLPALPKRLLPYWLRAFFDCEGWVENQERKSRLVGLECCNYLGILSIRDSLGRLGIICTVKKKKDRTIWRLTICGRNNLNLFSKKVGFNHPDKKQKLQNALNSYLDLTWTIPKNKAALIQFIYQKGRLRKDRGILRLFSVEKINLLSVKKALNSYGWDAQILGPWINGSKKTYYCLKLKEGFEK